VLEKTKNDYSLNHSFEKRIQRLLKYYFSRNPKFWSIFNDPGMRYINDVRSKHNTFKNNLIDTKQSIKNKQPTSNMEIEKSGLKKLYALLDLDKAEFENFSDIIKSEKKVPCPTQIDELLLFSGALSKNWEHPSSVENVVTMACDPAIYASMIGLLSNPNLAYKAYCEKADDLEKLVIRKMARLIGFNPDLSTGIFTQGGTFCNLYGYLLGIRKTMPETRQFGMATHQDYRFINSQAAHYSNIINLSLLGANSNDRNIRIKITKNNKIVLDDLENQLESCFKLKITVPCILLTLGTTDSFGVDEVKPIYDIRERLCKKYNISQQLKPHIHVDAAVGWPILFFRDYEFEKNPLNINDVTLEGLRRNTELFGQMQYADSCTIDFHKWGYVPYTSSLVMIKNKNDLKAMANCSSHFSYFEDISQGSTHLQSTIECSRGAVGMFGAYGALTYLGIEGYQTLVAHCLQNANYLRHKLQRLAFVKVFAQENQGPSVIFRIYDPETISSSEEEFNFEYKLINDIEYKKRVLRNSQWHNRSYKLRKQCKESGLFTSWVEQASKTEYNEKGECGYLPGEKAVFMNPKTSYLEIDLFVDSLSCYFELST